MSIKIGKVTVGATTHQTVRIKQSQKITLANPNLEPAKPNISLDDLVDVNTINAENGYTLLYDALDDVYKAAPISNVAIDLIAGGTF